MYVTPSSSLIVKPISDILQYPAVIIPFTHADPKLDPKDLDFVPLNPLDVLNEAKCKLPLVTPQSIF